MPGVPTTENAPSLADMGDYQPFYDVEAAQAVSVKAPLPNAAALRRRIHKRRMVQLSETAAAAEHLGQLPEPGEVIHSTMTGAFHGWSLVPAVLQLAGCRITRLDVATLGFSTQNAANLFDLMDAGSIGPTTFLVSTYFRSVDRSLFDFLHTGLHARGIAVYVRRTHAKVLVMTLADGREIVVESSANLRSCRNLEVFTMHRSAELAAFHRDWMQRLILETTDR